MLLRLLTVYLRMYNSCFRRVINERRAISTKRMMTTQSAAVPMSSPIIRPMKMMPGSITKAIKRAPMTVRQVNPFSQGSLCIASMLNFAS